MSTKKLTVEVKALDLPIVQGLIQAVNDWCEKASEKPVVEDYELKLMDALLNLPKQGDFE